jgi:hypothetical protein
MRCSSGREKLGAIHETQPIGLTLGQESTVFVSARRNRCADTQRREPFDERDCNGLRLTAVRLPLLPQEKTFTSAIAMSPKCL